MKIKSFIKKYWKIVILWLILFLFILASILGHFDKKISTPIILLYGLITQIFTAAWALLLSIAGAMPWIGPFIVKILLWPITIVINLLVVLVGFIKVKQGNAKKVLGAKIAITLLVIGILIGYLIGNLI